MDALLTSEQLAARYGYTTRAIEGWRYRGTGPRWITVGRRCMYPESEVTAWEKAKLEGASTQGSASAA